uniref:Uncharacterized protein n=1 Tax=Anguilla anguilla TaxID=7936 RepID=A0A0E9T5E1_ANGAN
MPGKLTLCNHNVHKSQEFHIVSLHFQYDHITRSVLSFIIALKGLHVPFVSL